MSNPQGRDQHLDEVEHGASPSITSSQTTFYPFGTSDVHWTSVPTLSLDESSHPPLAPDTSRDTFTSGTQLPSPASRSYYAHSPRMLKLRVEIQDLITDIARKKAMLKNSAHSLAKEEEVTLLKLNPELKRELKRKRLLRSTLINGSSTAEALRRTADCCNHPLYCDKTCSCTCFLAFQDLEKPATSSRDIPQTYGSPEIPPLSGLMDISDNPPLSWTTSEVGVISPSFFGSSTYIPFSSPLKVVSPIGPLPASTLLQTPSLNLGTQTSMSPPCDDAFASWLDLMGPCPTPPRSGKTEETG